MVSRLGLVEVLLQNLLLNLTDLVLLKPVTPQQDALGDRHNAAPVWDDLAEANDDALHLRRVDELAVDTILQVLDDLAEEHGPLLLVKEELAKSLCNTLMLLLLTLVRHLLHRLLILLLGIALELLFRRDDVERLL